jgi:hypothetical protein
MLFRIWRPRHNGCHSFCVGAQSTAACAGPGLEGGLLGGIYDHGRAEIAPGKHRPTVLVHRGLCVASYGVTQRHT